MSISVTGLSKRFGAFQVLSNVSLEVADGELVALLGPSGSGKTTLLRVIAGLEHADSGRVLFDGEDATDLSARDRRVGFVFQHYALFRHMTVFENVAFGLRVKPRGVRPSRAEIRARVEELLALVQLRPFADRYPSQLSGGQRQRVALARALAVKPRVLLLDEPFGALDAKVRKELRRWLRRLHEELHVTSLFVTHDQEEALELADRVVIMNEGAIAQEGTPEEVYSRPRSPFVYDFLGDVNLFRCRVDGKKLAMGGVTMELPHGIDPPSREGRVYVRPHLLRIVRQPPPAGTGFPARVTRITPSGALARVELTAAWGEPVLVDMARDRQLAMELGAGDEVFVAFSQEDLFVAPGAIEEPSGPSRAGRSAGPATVSFQQAGPGSLQAAPLRSE